MYNIQQLAAIYAPEPKVVVIAPPGSGKTHTMVGAIESFIAREEPKGVIAITFTKKAAEELATRLFAVDKTVHISTIHSWSLSELNNLSKKYKFRVKLLEEEEILNILKPFMEEYSINIKSRMICYYYVMGNINPDLYPSVRAKFDAIAKKYIDYKRERHLYDFTDLPLYLKTKLEDYGEFINSDGLFVDEFQDVDPVQLAVFDRVISPKKFFIGDPDQSIYIFRGATKDIFDKTNLQDFTKYHLEINYRSYQPIIDYASCFKNQDLNIIRDTLYFSIDEVKSNRGDGDDKCLVAVEHKGRFKNEVTQEFISLKTLIPNELETYTYKILCRTNKEVKELVKFGLDASTVHQAKGLEYDNVIVIDFEIKCEEDTNIAYVALTRAKNRLIVTRQEVLEEGLKYSNQEIVRLKSSGIIQAF